MMTVAGEKKCRFIDSVYWEKFFDWSARLSRTRAELRKIFAYFYGVGNVIFSAAENSQKGDQARGGESKIGCIKTWLSTYFGRNHPSV
jgi:hypothetical protein